MFRTWRELQLTGIGKNKGIRPNSKSRLKVPLAIQELPNKRFSRRHIDIHFDPSSSKRLEFTLSNPFLEFIEQFWIELFEPFVLLGLSCRESVLGVSFHQV